uniref:Arginine vasopressin-induced protein 1 n=1 Tax=Corvus moneduloides TaxID=1196302 RepID=A0A8C3GVG2_CORMO
MGTPASVVSDSPGQAAPAARARKRASANIFQGVGLLELRSLFRSGGAERPEERARLVWRYAGQRRMARALRRLRRRRRAQPAGGVQPHCQKSKAPGHGPVAEGGKAAAGSRREAAAGQPHLQPPEFPLREPLGPGEAGAGPADTGCQGTAWAAGCPQCPA